VRLDDEPLEIGDEGTYLVGLVASDGSATVITRFTIYLGYVPHPPQWDETSERVEGSEGSPIEFFVSGSDKDGDDLIIEATSDDLPEGWEFTDRGDGTGEFSWTPGYEDAGSYILTLTLSDGSFVVDTIVSIMVGNTNHPPEWDSVPDSITSPEGQRLTLEVAAVDPDGDYIRLSAGSDNLPEGWSFTDNGDGTGEFTWTPGYETAGEHALLVTATDGLDSISISVNNVNRAPQIAHQGVYQITEDEWLQFTLYADDPDGDDLSLRMTPVDLPEDATFIDNGDGTGEFRWLSDFHEAQDYHPVFIVSDGEMETDSTCYIEVSHRDLWQEWTVYPHDRRVTGYIDEELSVYLEAVDPEGGEVTYDVDLSNLPEDLERRLKAKERASV